MLNYMEYLDVPATIAFVLVGMFFVMQVIGELLEFRGKVVPEFVKVRKYFARKKRERETISKMADILDEHEQMEKTLKDVNSLLVEINKHYSEDNITMRDKWMKEVNEYILNNDKVRNEQDNLMRELSKKLDKNNADTLSILIENKRNTIIDFASRVSNAKFQVTKEQYNRIFKIYKEYEDIIEENNLTNGEVDIAIHIINKSYEDHLKNHSFIEDSFDYEQ